jgi:hypothetical protein
VIVYRASALSPRSPAEVFAYLAHFSHATQWDPGVVSATDITPGPPDRGSRYRLVTRFLGRSVPLEYRIEEIDTPRRVVLGAENAMVRSTDVIEVAAAPGGGSTVTYEATLTVKGPSVLLTPLVALAFRRIGVRATRGLRAVLSA